MADAAESFDDFILPANEGIFAGYIREVKWAPECDPIKRFISVKISDCSGTSGWAAIGSPAVIDSVLAQLKTVGWSTENICSAKSLFTLLESVAANNAKEAKFWFICRRKRCYSKDRTAFYMKVTFL